MAAQELPQKPFMVIAADFCRLNPIQGGAAMRAVCASLPTLQMDAVRRTKDPALLTFLSLVRRNQPHKSVLRDFFGDRALNSSLDDAARL
eukprot:1958290-Pyramimonas_sp.AAC.1